MVNHIVIFAVHLKIEPTTVCRYDLLPIYKLASAINYMCCYLSGFWLANVKIKQILKIILFLLGWY